MDAPPKFPSETGGKAFVCLNDSCDNDLKSRRSFLIGATATVAGIRVLNSQNGSAQTTQPATRVLDNPGIVHGKVIFKHGGKDTIDGYIARPKADGIYPAVLVIAGNRITEEYIQNTCAALALAGFVGQAPNIFHTLPDSARTPEEMRKASADHTDLDVLEDIQAGADYLRSQTFVKPTGMGILGFCYGGRMAMLRTCSPGVIQDTSGGPNRRRSQVVRSVPVWIHPSSANHRFLIR
jgi:Dienelactone hydrolase family